MEIPADVIGTSSNLPPIVDHSWLDVDLGSYDNYPSDNNSVRVVPKLHDIWDHSPVQSGINLIPNATVKPLGVRSSDEDSRTVTQIVREAKKAAMVGLRGKELSQYLRSRFASEHLDMAVEGLTKVAEEIGLLGNVYIDASAFNSYQEAENFLSQHRTRLARDILLHSDAMSSNAVSMLASTFHKNVVDKVEYNNQLFSKYKSHLISMGKIDGNTVIDSKETLRKAFLADKVVTPQEVIEKKEVILTAGEISAGLEKMAEDRSGNELEITDSLSLSKISPIVAFIQENLAKGKTASAVKDMLRSKFLMGDIKVAAEAIAITLSKEGLTEEHLNTLNKKEGKISNTLSNELKKIGKKYPIKKATIYEAKVSPAQVGVSGHLYTPPVKRALGNPYLLASVEALKKGVDLGRIRTKLLQKLSSVEAGVVLEDAVAQFNSVSLGPVANKAVKPKKALFPDVAPKKTLPDVETIIPQTQEILSFFEGANMDISIDAPFSRESVEVGELQNTAGISEIL